MKQIFLALIAVLSLNTAFADGFGKDFDKQFDTPFFRGEEDVSGDKTSDTEDKQAKTVDEEIDDFISANKDLNFNQWKAVNKSSKTAEARKNYIYRNLTIFFSIMGECSLKGGRFSKSVPDEYAHRKVHDYYGSDWSFFFACLNKDGNVIISDIYFQKSKDNELEHNLVIKKIDTTNGNKVLSTRILTAQEEFDYYETYYASITEGMHKGSDTEIFQYALDPIPQAKNPKAGKAKATENKPVKHGLKME